MENLGNTIMECMLTFGKVSKKDLIKKLNISGEEEIKQFCLALDYLEETGRLYLDDKGYYHTFTDDLILSVGQIFISKKGIGYVKNGSDRFIIENKDLNGALKSDIVLVRDLGRKYYGHQKGSVEKILKRDTYKQIYKYLGDGEFELYGNFSNVHFRSNMDHLGIGTLVIAEVSKDITSIEEGRIYFNGTAIKVIGHCDDPKSQIIGIGYKYGFDYKFSNKVMDIVSGIPSKVTEEDLAGRKDLRAGKTFTIDGSDTKDIDDAVSIIKKDDCYIVRVSIADVSHYVKPYKALVEDAINRGNSAYLADTVFPMFPHSLSNGICSLNEGKDRLAKTVEMIYDQDGNIVASSIYRSVINSKKKMTYEEVNKVLDGEEVTGYEDYSLELNWLNALSKKIQQRRDPLDFYSYEYKIKTDEVGNATSIALREQKDAEKIIENMMVDTNVEVAQYYEYLDLPFIYRVHEEPDLEKLEAALEILKYHGLCSEELICRVQTLIRLNKNINPCYIGNLLKNSKDKLVVSRLLLRCMSRAIYSPLKDIGHYGLRENAYLHFTSPIRRASDLINHIVLDYALDMFEYADDEQVMEEVSSNLYEISKSINAISAHITEREIEADKAEREIEELKQVQYVINNIDDFEGPMEAKVQGINKFGLLILVGGLIEAYIDMEDLSYLGYGYDPSTKSYVKSKKDTICLGDQITVSNIDPSIETCSIKYHALGKEEEFVPRAKRRSKKIF